MIGEETRRPKGKCCRDKCYPLPAPPTFKFQPSSARDSLLLKSLPLSVENFHSDSHTGYTLYRNNTIQTTSLKKAATMKTSLTTLLFASLAAGFDVSQYPNKRCTGMSVTARGINADKGCVVAREDGYTAGILNGWTGDGDNNVVLALYTGTKCCHANLIKAVNWEDSCIEIESGATVGSFRAVDPNDPDGAGGGYDTCEDEYEDNEVQKVEGVPPEW